MRVKEDCGKNSHPGKALWCVMFGQPFKTASTDDITPSADFMSHGLYGDTTQLRPGNCRKSLEEARIYSVLQGPTKKDKQE